MAETNRLEHGRGARRARWGFAAATALGVALATPAVAEEDHLLQVIDFETGDLSQVFQDKAGPDAAVEATDEIARQGQYSLRTTLTTRDRRAEVVSRGYVRPQPGEENWYGWSVYLPEDFPTDGRFDIFSQFHDFHKGQPDWSKTNRAPSCFVLHEGRRIGFDLKYQSEPDQVEHRSFEVGEATPGEWHDIVVNVNWTHEDDGFLKIWLNGEQVVDHTGPTYMDYGARNGPYFKAGNYKGSANWPGTSPRILYIDEYRHGNTDASYEDVDPARQRDE